MSSVDSFMVTTLVLAVTTQEIILLLKSIDLNAQRRVQQSPDNPNSHIVRKSLDIYERRD